MGWPGPVTHRQYLAWRDHLEAWWNEPDKGDHYLMQLTAQVTRPHLRDGHSVSAEDFRLKFAARPGGRAGNVPDEELPPGFVRATPERMARWGRDRWLAAASAGGDRGRNRR